MLSISQIKVQVVRESFTAYYMRTPNDIMGVWDNEISKSPVFEPEKEMCFVLMINAKNRIVNYNLVSMGSLDSSILEPREVFRPAIVSCSRSIILLHNHPSGNLCPSSEDICVTRKMVECGKILRINVLDHIIVSSLESEKGIHSMRENGNVEF